MAKRTKSVTITDEVFKIVNSLAEKREFSVSEAAEHLIKVGDTRVRTLAKHTAKRTKARRAAKKAEKKAEKSGNVIQLTPVEVQGAE